MEKKQINNAAEASEASEKCKATLKRCLEGVKQSANLGYNTHVMYMGVSDLAKRELMELGFTIGTFLDPMGVKQTTINW